MILLYLGQDSLERLNEFDENSFDAMRSLTGNIFSDEKVTIKILQYCYQCDQIGRFFALWVKSEPK